LIFFLWDYPCLMARVMGLASWLEWTRVYFFSFFHGFSFQFHPSTWDWLRIWLHNLFWFAYYWVILISWPRFSRLTWVYSGCFFVLFYFIFQFHHSTLGWLRIEIQNVFWIVFYKIITVSWLRSWILYVNLGLTRVDSICCCFNIKKKKMLSWNFLFKLCFF
jgi:hypothetical protein